MNKEKMQQLGHVIAGLIIMVPGFDAFERGDFKSAAGYLGVAVLFMLLAGWHKSFTQQFLQGDAAFFLLEAAIMFYSAWDYNTKGKTVLFFGMGAAGVIFVFFSLFSIKSNSDMPKRRKRRKKRRRSSPSGLFSEGLEKREESGLNKSSDRRTGRGSEDSEARSRNGE